MWKHHEATNLLTSLFLLFVLYAHLKTARALSDKRLCVDEHCREVISEGYGKINYFAGEEGMVSFRRDSRILVKSKEAGIKPTLWGVEVNGREGYVPKDFVMEKRVYFSKNVLKEVDVVQKTKAPVLSTSEKFVEQCTSEATLTKLLNLIPRGSSENLLICEKISAEMLPFPTPVLSEIFDGTTVPVSGNDENFIQNGDRNKKKEKDLITEINSEPEEYKIGNAEITGEQIKTEPMISEERKQNKNADLKQDIEAFKKEMEFVSTNLNKEIALEAEPLKEIISAESTNVVTESPVVVPTSGNENPFNSNDLAPKDQTANMHDDVKSDKIKTNIEIGIAKPDETISLEAANVVSENLVVINENSFNSSDLTAKDLTETMNYGEEKSEEIKIEIEIQKPEAGIAAGEGLAEDYILGNRNSFNINDLAAKDKNAQMLDGLKFNSEDDKMLPNKDNLQNLATLEDSKEKKDKTEINSIYENAEDNTNSSVIVPDQNLPNSNVDSIKNDLNKTQTELNVTTETTENNKRISEIEDQIHKALNEDKNVTNSNNFVSAKKAALSTDREVKLTTQSAVGTSESSSVVHENNHETLVNTYEPQYKTENLKPKEYYTDTNLNTEYIERNINELDSQKISPNPVLENSKTDESTNNKRHVGVSSSNLMEDGNSINVLNQQQVDNEAYADALLQTTEDSARQIDNINSFPTESVPYYTEPTKTELATETGNDRADKISSNSVLNTDQVFLNTIYQTSEEIQSQAQGVENINPASPNPIADSSSNTLLPIYQEEISTTAIPDNNRNQHREHSHDSGSIGSKTSLPTTNAQPDKKKDENSKVSPALNVPEPKENKGLFATIMGTVNNMLANNKKKQYEYDDNNELDRILFSQTNGQKDNIEKINEGTDFSYCKTIEPNGDCPESSVKHEHSASQSQRTAPLGSDLTLDIFLTTMASKILEMSQLIAFLGIAAAASLFFIFGYYCFCNSSREGALLLKLNQLESSLLASHKENTILKHNLMATRQKLASIEDNSFGSNDMVVSLKKELEEELLEKARLQEQITVLQKELENAADAGIELNKIVSELLSNQTGDESIISSVEELQKQLNEQQNTIYEINASLAEKSRENSELQLMIAEQNARYEAELANVQRDNDELEHEKGNLLTRLEEVKTDYDKDITAALEGKNMEIKRLQNDILDLNNNLENEHTKWQTSVAKIEALEECLKNVRKDPKVNISEVIDVVNVKAQLIEAQKMYKSLKERFETELDSKKLVENQLQVASTEVEKLKQDFNQSEKDKLEAQTRLEVLSNYFKDKENQLQKELNLKEAMWLKQQGETTTTVDRVTAMQEEIQSLKSQNESLRAEIEAQLAAHKAQIGTLENRAHETWLAARQSDRRYEEARAEATALRRKLTALAGGTVIESNKPSAGPAVLGDDLTQAPSPIHMESPASPMLGRMPPPPPFLPPPFMGPPPPFMGMPPPPPFVPPGEMRPAPLGRIMSPPPQRSGRFSPQHLDYEDYLDYEGNNTWQRYTYSPPPRTYRSLSPTDSRYNYGTERELMSAYDTETDFSPPPSPRESRRRVGNSSERIDSSTKISYGNTKKLNASNKGPLSSGSENSYNTHSHNGTKIKKGNATLGGNNLV